MAETGRRKRANYLPTPLALFKLRVFGRTITECTGEVPYLVGSAITKAGYRDVDVRLIVADDDFEQHFGGDGLWLSNDRLKLANMALSALAREMTGLDVDCQIQRMADANTEYGKGQRHALLAPGAVHG